jgi:hypothetical protein
MHIQYSFINLSELISDYYRLKSILSKLLITKKRDIMDENNKVTIYYYDTKRN